MKSDRAKPELGDSTKFDKDLVALRIYLLFIGPYDLGGEFNDRAITGVYRFLNRVFTLVSEFKTAGQPSDQLLKQLNQLNKKVSADLEELRFNTAIAALMAYLNELYKDQSNLSREILKSYVLMLAPLAPFLAEELWSTLGEKSSVHQQNWPDEAKVVQGDELVPLVVQVNGVFRDKLTIKKGTSQDQAKELALASEKVQKFTGGKKPSRTVWVADKLLNFVIE